jgi:hypothetical protein
VGNEIVSKQIFHLENQTKYLTKLRTALNEFITQHESESLPENIPIMDLYTKSAEYLTWTTIYHLDLSTIEFIASLASLIAEDDSVIDVGACTGFAGFSVALAGRNNVTFYDFEGIGAEFIRYFIDQEELTERCKFLPYSLKNDKQKYTWSIALDVLEHSGNQLAFLQWLANLGEKVAITYPLSVPFNPPYIQLIDDWVDDEAIVELVGKRYNILENYTTNGRRFLIFSV